MKTVPPPHTPFPIAWFSLRNLFRPDEHVACLSCWEQWPIPGKSQQLVLGHSIGQHWLKSHPRCCSSLNFFFWHAEELLKVKEACLLAISSFRRFWKHQRRLRPSPIMIAETISLACLALLVVVFCCVIKIYTMVKNIRPSRNERLCVDYARDSQNENNGLFRESPSS